MGNLRNENLSLLKQLNLMGGKSKRSIYIDDSLLKGGFRVVNTIEERDAIDCCHRKWGMEVTVVGPDLDFIRYTLRSRKCSDNLWIVSNAGLVSVNEAQVDLIEDYSELEENLANQRDLNLALKRAILQLQQEVIDIPTNTSELVNDGEDGINPFITLQDIPVVTVPTKTSDLINDGEGIDPFITLAEVPAQTPQVKSDWNATSGPEEILNKPTIPVLVPQEQSDWNAVSGVSFIKNKPTIPAPVDISNKLDKPTADGTWVVTKSGSTIFYTDASTLGQNISNANLTWTVDRVQNLGTHKLSFTNGRFSVPTLEMEVTTATSVPNKIWNDGDYAKFTDKNGINKTLGFDGDCTCVITTADNITTNTIGDNGKSQHGREVAIANGTNNINLTCLLTSEPNFVASYTKEGTGIITILAGAGGVTLFQSDGTNKVGGGKGTTFCIKRSGNEFKIFISIR